MKRFMTVAMVLLGMTVAFVTACGDDNDSPTGPSQNTPTGSSSMGLGLSFNGLERLGSDFVYEGWILVDGNPVSTGTFRVRDDGSLSQLNFPVDEAALSSATKFILSIEPSPDSDPAPSGTKYLAGDFAGNSAALSVADGAALGSDFTSASGSFILETPSTAAVAGDYASGIWWLNPAGHRASLVLPEFACGLGLRRLGGRPRRPGVDGPIHSGDG